MSLLTVLVYYWRDKIKLNNIKVTRMLQKGYVVKSR